VLVAELQHRTRNLMGVIRSMVDKTGRASADLANFRAQFHDRLEALARVQGLLSRLNEHDRVTFDELIESELEALEGSSADHVSLEGPRGVRLRSSMVQTLAMALHELATNAVKYGALGQPRGRLAVTWSLDLNGAGGRPWLHVDWRESGVTMPPVGSTPNGGGQGRELIERALPYQLSAKTSYELGADGVHCTISMPVSVSPLSQELEHA
jgi:two-component sensor histidine kinase